MSPVVAGEFAPSNPQSQATCQSQRRRAHALNLLEESPFSSLEDRRLRRSSYFLGKMLNF